MQTAPMPTVQRLEAALTLAERLGYRIRLESLIGETGGGCEIRGQKWLFVDLSLTPREQLEQVLATLRREAASIRAASSAEKPRGAGILRCAQNDTETQNGSGAQNDAGRLTARSTETSTERELSPPAPKSAQGFLPRWRRWYKIMVSRQSGSR